MKRFAWLVGACGLSVWGLSSAIAGCGGEEAAGPGADDDASTNASTSSSSSTSSSGGSSSTSSSGGTDGGGEGGPADGGPTDGGSSSGATPKTVPCGSTQCAAGTQTCCIAVPSLDAGCIASGSDCNGVPLDCDDKSDCTGGKICCGNLGGTECRSKCGKVQYQLCKSDAECASDAGGGCKMYTCPGGRQVQTCSKPLGCN